MKVGEESPQESAIEETAKGKAAMVRDKKAGRSLGLNARKEWQETGTGEGKEEMDSALL